MNLTPDIIGSNPKGFNIVNHGWLEKEPCYDNYPSTNESVRVGPQLVHAWNPEVGRLTMIPGYTDVKSPDSEDEIRINDVIREAKKAVMMGLSEEKMVEHLSSRFPKKVIVAAGDAIKKVSGEIGLLGNVYIDASAFESYKEAEKFIGQNRNRLAKDILVESGYLTPEIINLLASKFRKNVVASVVYDDSLFQKYEQYLKMAGRIPSSMKITSKEELRAAFMYQSKVADTTKKKESLKSLSPEKKKEVLLESGKVLAEAEKEISDILFIKKVCPVIECAQECLSKGKDMGAVKEILRNKFSQEVLEEVAPVLLVWVKSGGLTDKKNVSRETFGDFSPVLVERLCLIAEKFPIKEKEWEDTSSKSNIIGKSGYFYNMENRSKPKISPLCAAAVVALEKGVPHKSVLLKLQEKVSKVEAMNILGSAVGVFNSILGRKANKLVLEDKKLVFPEKDRKVYPTKEDTEKVVKDIKGYFEGTDMDVSIDKVPSYTSTDIEFSGAVL